MQSHHHAADVLTERSAILEQEELRRRDCYLGEGSSLNCRSVAGGAGNGGSGTFSEPQNRDGFFICHLRAPPQY